MLAARMNWRWLSTGQALRDTHDPEIQKELASGQLASHETVTKIMSEAIARATNVDRLILDGFPRKLEQAQWLVESQTDRVVQLAIVLEVPMEELLKRLEIRGRADDTPESIDERLAIYRKETYPILNYFTEQDIPVVHIDGAATVGQVHDRIVAELTSRGLAR